MRKISLILVFILANLNVFSEGKVLRYQNYIYEKDIESVTLSKGTEIYNPMAIIALNGTEKLTLIFDELKNTNSFYQFSFVHCDAAWNPSNLQTTEYVSGNQMENIAKTSYSTNTFQKYVRYQSTFPTDEMKITKSGNYLLKVFRNFEESDLVITRRFMVIDNKTRMNGVVSAASDPAVRFSKHEIDFTADYKEYNIPNPFLDVKVTTHVFPANIFSPFEFFMKLSLLILKIQSDSALMNGSICSFDAAPPTWKVLKVN